jgi:hypothetical protein
LFAAPQDQGGKGGVEQQLSAHYSLTRVSDNGVVLQPGTVLLVRFFGIKANPVSGDIYWPNSYRKGGRIGQPVFFAKRGVSKVVEDTRFLLAGTSAYVTNIEIKDADVVLSLQTCGGGPAGNEPNGGLYRANVAFQFQKGFVNPANVKQIEDTIAELLAVVPPGANSNGNATQAVPSVPVPPRLGPLYVSSQNSADRIQLNGDNTFSLQEGGQSFSGTYLITGTTLKLHIVELQKDVNIAIQGNRLIVNGEEVWIQPNR